MIDRIAIWIEPKRYYSISNTVQVFEGVLGSIILGESSIVDIPAEESDNFYDFQFPSPITLNADTEYSWKLVPESRYSGAFRICKDTIPGNGYRQADLKYPERNGGDYPFKLYILA